MIIREKKLIRNRNIILKQIMNKVRERVSSG